MSADVRPPSGVIPGKQLALPLPDIVPNVDEPVDAADGERLVADMAAGRAWWKLRAGDVAPWIRSLPVAVRADRENRLGWLGRPWDGVTDLPMGERQWDGETDIDRVEPLVDDVDAWEGAAFPGREMKRLVAELGRLIAGLPGLGVAIPESPHVRAALVGEEGDLSEPTAAMAVVDFDLGGMILPIGVEDWQLSRSRWTPVEQVAALMVEKLVHAARHRRKLLRRERRMREGFERDVARLGGGAAPLWLRMEPVRFDARVSDLFRQPYVALDVRLDIHQVWAPSGIERVGSPPRLRELHSAYAGDHRRSLRRLEEMRSTRSLGWISDVALALIEQTGRNPAVVFLAERAAALHDEDKGHYGCDGRFGGLFCHYGVLTPYFIFKGGSYVDGELTLDGAFPELLAVAAPGRPLAQYVDHPALRASGALIDRAERCDRRLRLFHTSRLVTVEEAVGRWRARKGTSAGTIG